MLFVKPASESQNTEVKPADVATARLELVEEVVEWWDALFQALAFPGIVDNPG